MRSAKWRSMKIKVVTLFPEMFDCMHVGIIGKAIEKGLVELECVNIRDYSKDRHRKTDDYPFGGGAGMVMTVQPLHDCVNAIDPERKYKRIYMSPRGATLAQDKVVELSKEENLLFICGSYEGVDERFIELDVDEELSVGDYVLTGGELPCMVTVNAIARYVDGVLGSEQSVEEESFSNGLLEYPQYTRPAVFEGLAVPDVLLSGNHAAVDEWRKAKQIEITRERRPDMYEKIRPIIEKELEAKNRKKRKKGGNKHE